MSTTSRTAPASADDLAASVRDASFVRLLPSADGDALAAAGLLARACRATGRPFQVTVTATVDERTACAERAADAGSTPVVVGPANHGAGVTVPTDPGPASATAFAAARSLGANPDPTLALAGSVAAGVPPGAGDTATLLEAAREAGEIARRPGVAGPTGDPADDLAHTTFTHALASGDADAARETVAAVDAVDDPDPDARRRVASAFVLDVVSADGASERAAEEVGRAVRPHVTPEGPFETVEGFADVLAATATDAPGTGVALALGHDATDAALETWRDHARRAHATVESATTGRYDGLLVARTEDDAAPVRTVARLLRDVRSPEPVVLVVTDGEAAAAAVPDAGGALGETMRQTVAGCDGEAAWDGTTQTGYARFDVSTREFITAFREAR